MGTGRLKAGKYDVTVVADFVMSPQDWSDWERALKKASEILWDASDGQLEFGTFYVCDDGIGRDTADFVLHDAGDPSYNSGRFGEPGAAMHLMPYVKNAILTVLHEWGHHAWRLKEEYSAALFSDEIDDTNPAPDSSTIPIVDTGRADDELVALQADAILKFGPALERRAVIANTATTVTVDAPFSDLPTNNDYDEVYYQTPAECATDSASDFCIMENSRTAAGSFNASGDWVPAVHPVTEYCTASNHDPDNDTAQEDEHGKSCWEVITGTPGYETLDTPDPADPGPEVGFTVSSWIVLDKQPRFALVLDRSGSMSAGHKMADAQHGAVFWLEFCAEGPDRLAIVWYDHAIDRILDLTQVDTLPDLVAQTDAINALAPRGSTNIRDGLFAGLDQIQAPAARAAVQVAVLLTDGKHNTPAGSQADEVLPDFQAAGVRIYTLGVGTPDRVDMDLLDRLAANTSGRSYAVGDDNPGDVEAAMVEINAEVRGGIVTTQPNIMPDAKGAPLERVVAGAVRSKKRPPFKAIQEELGIGDIAGVVKPRTDVRATLVAIPADIERTCERASFTLVYPEGERLWLYLIDPSGAAIDMGLASVRHVISAAPHEFAIVTRPRPGRWYMVAVRPSPGAAFSFRAVAGAENRRLQVFGGASPLNPLSAPVRVWASARWGDTLTGLRVTATITDPAGARRRLRLSDATVDEPNCGQFEAAYQPTRTGRHYGSIDIVGRGRVTGAQPLHRLLHLEKGARGVETKVDVPPFRRVVRFYFDVGERPKVADEERRKGLVERYQPRRLRGKPESAAATHRTASAGKGRGGGATRKPAGTARVKKR